MVITPTLDRASPVPLYAQLIKVIRTLVTAGNWTAHSRIPSERELCAVFQVSRVTVRQALQVLVRKKLLVQTSGRGTYLAHQPSSTQESTTSNAVAGHLLQHGTHPGGWRIKPPHWLVPTHVRSALGGEEGVTLTCLSRWRQPEMRETVYLRNDCCPAFRTRHHNDVPLYETLSRYYGLEPEHAMLQWYAPGSSTAITESDGVATSRLVLRVRQTTFTRDGRAFEHVEVHDVQPLGVERHPSADPRGRSR